MAVSVPRISVGGRIVDVLAVIPVNEAGNYEPGSGGGGGGGDASAANQEVGNDYLADIAAAATDTAPALVELAQADYETVAASQTDQALGATGAAGDYLAGLLIVPATTSPGAVSIKDGAGGSITIFTGGASSVSNLVPLFIPLGIKSVSGAWKLTTGANVSAICVGEFT